MHLPIAIATSIYKLASDMVFIIIVVTQFEFDIESIAVVRFLTTKTILAHTQSD